MLNLPITDEFLTMTNLVAAANGKLDDPIMREWAVRFYDDLPSYAHDERKQIEADWFHDFFIAQLIDCGETSLLAHLFRILPPEHLLNFKTLMVKNWLVWPRPLVESTAKILAVTAPDELLRLFENDLNRLKQGGTDPLRFLSIEQLRTSNDNAACAAIVNQFSELVLDQCPDNFIKSMLILSLLKVSRHLSWESLASLLDTALRLESSEVGRRSIFEALFTGLFEHSEFLTMMFDREKFELSLQLTALQPLFVASAPLAKLDSWLQASPELEETFEILENLSEQSLGCKTLLGLLQDSRIAARLSDKVQVQLSIAAILQGYVKSSLDTVNLDLPTTINLLSADIANPHWSKALTAHLHSFDQQSVIPALTSRLLDCLDSYGATQIVEAMGNLGYSAFVAPLITAMSGEGVGYLSAAARSSLTEIGKTAQAVLIEQWDKLDDVQQIYGLSVITSVKGNAAADFAVARFSELLVAEVESACELILASPDSRLLDLLKPELRRQQALIDRTFYICARLLGYDGPETQEAKKRALAEFERCNKLFDSVDVGVLPRQEQLFVELECPLCNGVNQYKAEGVVISDDPDAAFLLNDEFPCASCGQAVEFEFTPMSRMALSVAFLGSQVSVKEGRQQNNQFKQINYKVDGNVMPLATGLAKIRKHLRANPNDALEWYRLGNLLSFLNRPNETANAYHKALSIKPSAIDATLALATLLTENRQETEALTLLQEAIERIPSWIFLLPTPNFSHDFVDLYNALIRTLGRKELPALHPSALALPKKVGRNDSCPCGSGKKFKKCCGR